MKWQRYALPLEFSFFQSFILFPSLVCGRGSLHHADDWKETQSREDIGSLLLDERLDCGLSTSLACSWFDKVTALKCTAGALEYVLHVFTSVDTELAVALSVAAVPVAPRVVAD